jgi:hypothetical protein
VDYVYIQIQDGGIWKTITSLPNNSQRIISEMQSVKRIYPNLRVRTVDENDRLIDMLT